MSLESGSLIAQLVDTNPLVADPVSQGDDHLRLLKKIIKNDVAAKASVNTFTASQIFVDGVRIDGQLSVSLMSVAVGLDRTLTNLAVLGQATLTTMAVRGPATFSSMAVSSDLTFTKPVNSLPSLFVHTAITTSSLAVLAGTTNFGDIIIPGKGSFSSITIDGYKPINILAWAQIRVTISATIAAQRGITGIVQLGTGEFQIGTEIAAVTLTSMAFIGSAKNTRNDVTNTALSVLHALPIGVPFPLTYTIWVQRTRATDSVRDPEQMSIMWVGDL